MITLSSPSLLPFIKSLIIQDDSMGSDHKIFLLEFVELSLTTNKSAPLREVWRIENIPKSGRCGDQPLYRDFVDKYQNAFAHWLVTASALVAAGDDHQSTADSLEKSFQTCLDDVSEQVLGRKLVGAQ